MGKERSGVREAGLRALTNALFLYDRLCVLPMGLIMIISPRLVSLQALDGNMATRSK